MKLSLILMRKEVSSVKSPGSKGQGMVEYALILVLVAIVIIIAISTMGPSVGNMYLSVNKGL